MTDEFTDALAQCEQCDKMGLEENMKRERVPGATLFFCQDCAEKPYRKQVL